MKRILTVFGTRPEAIKMAPVVKELRKHPDQFDTIVCVTAQHREMLDQVLEVFDIRPDFDLNIMRRGQDLHDITADVLLGMRQVLEEAKPDLVLVHGDTTTTMAGTLAAFYARIPIGHVEAGLRTGDKYAPFPEEINRKVTGAVADLHFAPTEQARRNLLNDGVATDTIHVTGNTVIDALFLALEKIRVGNLEREIVCGLTDRYPSLRKVLSHRGTTQNSKFKIQNSDNPRLILVTGHRRENFGEGFERICKALKLLAAQENVRIIYPVHLNPGVREPVLRLLGDCPNIHLIEPLGYLPFIYLMSRSYLILTDSGGIQEEAPSLGKPVLVMRETTERPEAVEAGTVRLVGTDMDNIVLTVAELLNDRKAYDAMSHAHNPYGDGNAAKLITNKLLESGFGYRWSMGGHIARKSEFANA